MRKRVGGVRRGGVVRRHAGIHGCADTPYTTKHAHKHTQAYKQTHTHTPVDEVVADAPVEHDPSLSGQDLVEG